MRLLPYLLTIFLLVPGGYAALAQTSDTLQTVELADVVISENRLQTPFSESARSISLITRAEIERAPVQSVNELLSYVAGVDIRQRGPAGVQGDVGLRGGTFEQTLVLINGVKISDPQTGHHQLSLPIDITAIERIEVLKGPAARVYGQNAFAGAINIVTKVPEERAVSAGVYGGDFDTFGGHAGWSLPGKSYHQYLSVSHDRSDGYRPNSDYQITNAFYQAYLEAGSGRVNFMGGHTQRAFGASGFYAPESNEYETVSTTLASVDYQGKTNRWTYQPRVYWRRNHDDYQYIRSNPAAYNNFHTTHSAGAELNTTYRHAGGLTGLGMEVRHERIDSYGIRTRRDTIDGVAILDTLTAPALGQRQRTTVGLFAEHRFYLFDRLDITPGVYVNWYSDYGWNWFPGIDASWELTPAWKLFANAGRSFRIPTYTELYYEGPSNVGNDQLQPEDAVTYEAGVKYFGHKVWGQVSLFRRDASQLIDWVRTVEDAPWQPRNFYNVDVMGAEIEINATLNRDTDDWIRTLSLSYTYLDADLEEVGEGIESRYALSNLKHQVVFSVDHKIWNQVRHNLRTRYLDRAALSNYFLWDSRIYLQTPQLTLYAEATNLTNTEYSEAGYVPMPGRWLRVGVDVTLPY